MNGSTPRTTALVLTLGLVVGGAGGSSAEGPDRLPLVLPQCVAAAFAPGVVTPGDGELYGPTDVNAQTANGSLAVGLNREGTVTVFRWPRPSFYDQIKEFTLDRSAPYYGAYPNEGAFLGLVIGSRTSWLRDWRVAQRFASRDSDEVVTDYARGGVRVRVRDVVPFGSDVLARRISVRVSPDAERPAALVAFENFNLVTSKASGLPGQDWCTEEQNDDEASFEMAADAIVHAKTGVDESTREVSSVAVAMGLDGRSSAHQVGGDGYEPSAAPDGRTGPREDAYTDAADGTLSGNDTYAGQTTGALLAPLRYRGGRAATAVYLAAGSDSSIALGHLRAARRLGEAALANAKVRRLHRLLARAPLPATRDRTVLAVAERALVLLLTTADRGGAIVASITTQPPYGEDWPRDGSFFDYALDHAGYLGLAAKHNAFYVRTQATETTQPRGSYGVPPGNWAMNYYADGVNGGPIPWEIDETGFAIWSLWDHYAVTHDRAYLRRVYPAIQRAADFLVQCRDPQTGLQCYGTEDDNFRIYQEQTILGATTTWMGIERAARAARVLGRLSDLARYRERSRELAGAIDAHLWNGHDYGGTWGGGSYVIWPARLRPYDDPRIQAQARYIWQSLRPTFLAPHGPISSGAYEAKGLMALALVYRHTDPAKLSRVRMGLRWIAHVEATADTALLGETWRVRKGRVLTYTAVPHLWEHVLFYLASLEGWGSGG